MRNTRHMQYEKENNNELVFKFGAVAMFVFVLFIWRLMKKLGIVENGPFEFDLGPSSVAEDFNKMIEAMNAFRMCSDEKKCTVTATDEQIMSQGASVTCDAFIKELRCSEQCIDVAPEYFGPNGKLMDLPELLSKPNDELMKECTENMLMAFPDMEKNTAQPATKDASGWTMADTLLLVVLPVVVLLTGFVKLQRAAADWVDKREPSA